MKKQGPRKVFQLRFDGTKLPDKLIEWLGTRFTSWLLLREEQNGVNPHIQGFGFSPYSRKTFSRDFKQNGLSHFYKTNTDFSIISTGKITIDNDLLKYTCKGSGLSRYDRNYFSCNSNDYKITSKQINQYNIDYWESRKEYKKQNPKKCSLLWKIIHADFDSIEEFIEYYRGLTEERAKRYIIAYYFNNQKILPNKHLLYGIARTLVLFVKNGGQFNIHADSGHIADVLALYENI